MRPASTPDTPTASMSISRQMASSFVLMRPLSTIEVASMAFSSVTRRPCTMRVGTPMASVTCVSCGPPPCTITTLMPR